MPDKCPDSPTSVMRPNALTVHLHGLMSRSTLNVDSEQLAPPAATAGAKENTPWIVVIS
jgi:hypothetical protein